MASAPIGMTPPPTPGGAGPSPATQNPTSPPVASPAPPKPSPGMQQGTEMAIQVARNLQAIAKMFPTAAPNIAKMNDILREVVSDIMQDQQASEPAAPPTSG